MHRLQDLDHDESEIDATSCQPLSSPLCEETGPSDPVQAPTQMLSESGNVCPHLVFDVCTSSPHVLTHVRPPFLLNSSSCDDMSKASVMMHDPSTWPGRLQSSEFADGSSSFLLQKSLQCDDSHLAFLCDVDGYAPSLPALTHGQPPFLLNMSFRDDMSKVSEMSHGLFTHLDDSQSFEFAAGSLAFSVLPRTLSYCNGIHLVPLQVQSGFWSVGIPPMAAPPWLQSALVLDTQSHIPCCIWSLSCFDGFTPSLPVFTHVQPPFLLNTSFCDGMSKVSEMTQSLSPEVDQFQSFECAAGSLAFSFLLQKLSYCNDTHLMSLQVQSGAWPVGIPPVAAPPWRLLVRINKFGWQGGTTLCSTTRVLPLGPSISWQVSPCRRHRRVPPDDCGLLCSASSRKALGPSRGYG